MTTIRNSTDVQAPKPASNQVNQSNQAVPAAAQQKPTTETQARSSFQAPAPAKKQPVAGLRDAPQISQVGTPAQPVKRQVTFTFDAGPHADLTDVRIKGSWDKNGNPSTQWTDGIQMKSMGNGKWSATVELLDDGSNKEVEWGVTVDSKAGNDQWAVFGEGNLKTRLGPNIKEASYAPTTYHEMGAHKVGDKGIGFKYWAPNAQNVNVKITSETGKVERMPMTRNADGTWSASSATAWSRLEGKAYTFEVTDSDGNIQERTDPYARRLQGEQKGLGRFYLDPATGEETQKFTPNKIELMRFEIDDVPNATEAYLTLKDESGHPLTKAELLERLGTIDPKLVSSARGGKFNDLWSENVLDDGRIKMTDVGGAFSTVVNKLDGLQGLRYELNAYAPDRNGKLRLVDDKNKDGKLSKAEARASNYNDRWSNVITGESGLSFRGGIVADTSKDYQFKYDAVPRETDKSKWVIYQMHTGSFLASSNNANRSTFEDAMAKLDYLKGLGINTIEMLPANEVESNRDWGYMGANNMAVESSLGFEDEKGKWVTGDQALKMFIDEAHKRGMNVLNDVVYNHVGGDFNDMYNLDGSKNPYFNWNKDPDGNVELRHTPWGVIPAFNQDKVRQFFVDHAVAQIADYKFDGLRFDFTEPIKGVGGKAGWELLREINRQVHFYNPKAFTMAEQFDYDPAISEPAQANGAGGGGFDAQWYTEYQHRLVRDNDNPGLVQSAADNKWTNMDGFMNLLTNPRGLNSWSKAVSMISNHDEVGNALRTIDVADGPGQPAWPNQFARSASRFAAGMGFAGPGMPMFFQGDESLANNIFKWGKPNTWDNGWEWEKTGQSWDWKKLTFNDAQKANYDRLFALSPADRAKDLGYTKLSSADKQVFEDLAKLPPAQQQEQMHDIVRRQTNEFYKAAIALRQSSPAFQANAEIKKVYTHNDDSVMAFERKGGNDDFVVVGSLNRDDLEHYKMSLPPGQWQEVFNSDGQAFGGDNFGNYGATINGGNAEVNIPAGGYVVFKKVG